ncbi:hypothetical protein [Dactylosporangium sp. NPDC005555]|uniref:hypothetical protein n=1 Tax=Dactylosporangium sp. NPDC005555 TaxID=3154889 RepID=UPI0033AD1036
MTEMTAAGPARPRRIKVLVLLLLFLAVSALMCAFTADEGPYSGLPAWTYAVLGFAYLAGAWAMWRARPWVWWTLLVVYGGSFVHALFDAWATSTVEATFWFLLWRAAFLVVLLGGRTRAWFGIDLWFGAREA